MRDDELLQGVPNGGNNDPTGRRQYASYARQYDRYSKDIDKLRSARRVLIAWVVVCISWIVAMLAYGAVDGFASPRVTPQQAERAAASWTRWYWSAANPDVGGGYTVNDLRVSCERTPQSTRRYIRCAATYYVTDPIDATADVGSFEDFHRVCVARKVAKAAHAIAAPDARIARTTIRIRKHVVLDCKYVSFNDTRYG